MTFYFDTSALVKLAVIEHGSELAAELWDTRRPAASSVLSYPEGRAALAAARRGGRLTVDAHGRALQDLEIAYSELTVVGIDVALARHAGELAEELGLRGYDAVHLASALALGEEAILVTWDLDLGRAAAHVGCAVAPG